jgi:hypothetical protein
VNPRPIIFGPGDKLRWLEAVAFSPSATAFHARLAIALNSRIDKHVGTATVGQQWLASKTGGTERGVRKALLRMQRLGLLVASRPATGRGNATIYRPITPMEETRNDGSAFYAERRNGGSGERRNGEAQNPEPASTKPGTVVPILPKILQSSSYPVATERDPNQLTWLSVKEKMKAHLGADMVAGWFEGLTVQSISQNQVVMTAPNKFVLHWINDHLLNEGLLAGWRRVLPSINDVRLIEASHQRAAE